MASVAARVKAAKPRLRPASAPVLRMLQKQLEEASSALRHCRGVAVGSASAMQERPMHVSGQLRLHAPSACTRHGTSLLLLGLPDSIRHCNDVVCMARAKSWIGEPVAVLVAMRRCAALALHRADVLNGTCPTVNWLWWQYAQTV